MPLLVVDIAAFTALLAAFLWLAEVKQQGRWLAVLGAATWPIGGVLATPLADLLWVSVSEDAVRVLARVGLPVAAFLFLWSRPDWLPTRTVNGVSAACVYREPGPVTAERVADFLKRKGLAATCEGYSVWVTATDLPQARAVLPGFVSWTLVLRGRSAMAARMAADWLGRNGIEAQVRGELKTGVMGGVPVPDSFPDVWVRGADRLAAEALIASMDAPETGTAWTCPGCGEENGPAFAACWSCQTARA